MLEACSWEGVCHILGEVDRKKEAYVERKKELEYRYDALLRSTEKLRRDREKLASEIKDLMGEINTLKEQSLQQETPYFFMRDLSNTTPPIVVMKHSLERKKIKTLLHSILDRASEKDPVTARDLACEFDVGVDEIVKWARVLEKKNMLQVNMNLRGQVFLRMRLEERDPQVQKQ